MNRVDVDTIYTTSGERYDFIVNANQPEAKGNLLNSIPYSQSLRFHFDLNT